MTPSPIDSPSAPATEQARDASRAIVPTNDWQIDPQALPCPFCGGPAETQLWHGGLPTKVFIACSQANDRLCEVGPQVTGETHAEGLAHWNRRAPFTREPAHV